MKEINYKKGNFEVRQIRDFDGSRKTEIMKKEKDLNIMIGPKDKGYHETLISFMNWKNENGIELT